MNKHILVIDDTEILAHSIAELLSMEGFTVSVANSGTQGLSAFHQKCPDLILTDLIMPDMTGFEVIRYIRSAKEMNTIPIIVLTADTNAENEEEARNAGADLLLHKPFDEDNLISSITNLLQNE
jgi:DNA-binding response OmpR family regulator